MGQSLPDMMLERMGITYDQKRYRLTDISQDASLTDLLRIRLEFVQDPGWVEPQAQPPPHPTPVKRRLRRSKAAPQRRYDPAEVGDDEGTN